MSVNEGATSELRDDQQLQLVQRLRAAGGGPLDFEELRAMGIEHPAVVCYELEIAGVPIVQTRESDRRMLALDLPTAEPEEGLQSPEGEEVTGVPTAAGRLAAGGDAARSLAQRLARAAERIRGGAFGWGTAAVLGGRAARTAERFRAARRGRPVPARSAPESLRNAVARVPEPSAAWAVARGAFEPFARRAGAFLAALGARRGIVGAWLALAAVLAAVVTILLSAHAGAVHAPQRADAARLPARPARTVARAPEHSTSAPAPPRPSPGPARTSTGQLPGSSGGPAVRISLTAATTLEREGHQLLADGRYASAIGHLLGAVRATGQSPERCTEPTTEACLTFAYALYDLGRALRLNGQSAAAIPVLSRRLRIDNQRNVVEHELDLARGAST